MILSCIACWSFLPIDLSYDFCATGFAVCLGYAFQNKSNQILRSKTLLFSIIISLLLYILLLCDILSPPSWHFVTASGATLSPSDCQFVTTGDILSPIISLLIIASSYHILLVLIYFVCSSFSINHIFVILSMDLMTVRLLTSKNFAIVSRDIVHRGISGFFDRW